MPTLTETSSINYDFCIIYDSKAKHPTLGEKLSSPIKDSRGQVIEFSGTAIVVCITEEWLQTKIYIQVCWDCLNYHLD